VDLVAARVDVHDAVAWCPSTGRGATAAIKTGEFPFATVEEVRQARSQHSPAPAVAFPMRRVRMKMKVHPLASAGPPI
jgi:hypothetical protein